MTFSFVRIAFALLLTSVATDDRPGDFKIIGPGGGGAMFHPQISPHDPNTVLVNWDMTGAYISHDGGKSWRMFNLRGVVEFFVFEPLEGKVMYAEANGFVVQPGQWRELELGLSKALDDKGRQNELASSDENLVAEPNPLGTISAMAIDPENSKNFYLTAGNRAQGVYGLFISRDGGESWTKMEDLPRFANKIYIDPFAAGDVKTLIVPVPLSSRRELRPARGIFPRRTRNTLPTFLSDACAQEILSST